MDHRQSVCHVSRLKEAPADQPPAAASSIPAGASSPGWLLRSSVYRRLPLAKRGRLDAAILLRPAGLTTLEAIAERFNLQKEYSIAMPALRQYARRLEEWARPAATSQVMAAVLGCLPESYRRRLVAGSEVLLLSRVVQTLSAPGTESLSVAELAKLASLLGDLRPLPPKPSRQLRRSTGTAAATTSADSHPANAEKLAAAVRMLYGLPWPVDANKRASSPPRH